MINGQTFNVLSWPEIAGSKESITSLQTSSIPLFLQLGKKISNILTYWKFCNNEISHYKLKVSWKSILPGSGSFHKATSILHFSKL
jgi:hypothetical protein